MSNVLLVDQEKCRACRTCELACSFFKEGKFNPEKSRIRSERWESASLVGKHLTLVCQQCTQPSCKAVCPCGAIDLDKRTGAIRIDRTLCNACGACISECSFGSISRDPETGVPLVCDLCNGTPKCEEWCPAGAIRYVRATSSNLREKRKASALLLTSVKQLKALDREA